MTSSKMKKNLIALVTIVILAWNANDQYEQMSLLPANEKMPAIIYHGANKGPKIVIPFEGSKQVVFFFTPKDQVSIITAKMIKFALRLLPKDFKVLAVAQNYTSYEEVDLFQSTRLKVPTYYGSTLSYNQNKLFKLPILYFVNSSGTISQSTLGFTTPIGIVVRAYLVEEDKEEYKWWRKF